MPLRCRFGSDVEQALLQSLLEHELGASLLVGGARSWGLDFNCQIPAMSLQIWNQLAKAIQVATFFC